MKSALSLALIVCLVGSTMPLAAQERLIEPTSGPIARAAKREAARLALASQADAADANWSRVRKLAPGTAITLTIRSAPAARRYLVSADESGIAVLNVADPTLPPAVRRVLLDTASNHSDYFAGAQNGGRFLLDNDVSLVSDGVFVAGQKVADLGLVVEKTARTDVVEVRGESARRHPAAWGALIGAAIGAGVEGVSIGAGCGSDGCYGNLLMALFAGIGAGAGAGIGAAIGASRHKTEDNVIYRAP